MRRRCADLFGLCDGAVSLDSPTPGTSWCYQTSLYRPCSRTHSTTTHHFHSCDIHIQSCWTRLQSSIVHLQSICIYICSDCIFCLSSECYSSQCTKHKIGSRNCTSSFQLPSTYTAYTCIYLYTSFDGKQCTSTNVPSTN